MSFRVLSLDHITVTTPELLERDVVSWYRDVLGLEEMTKPEGSRPQGAWFQLGDQELHVLIDEHNPHKAAHFGLVVDDFDRVVERLRAGGCHIEQAREIVGRRRCFTRDPAGNGVEIICFNHEGKN